MDEHEKWMLEEKLVEPEERNEKDEIITPEDLLFNRKLPHFGATIKLHKNNQARWISKCHKTFFG